MKKKILTSALIFAIVLGSNMSSLAADPNDKPETTQDQLQKTAIEAENPEIEERLQGLNKEIEAMKQEAIQNDEEMSKLEAENQATKLLNDELVTSLSEKREELEIRLRAGKIIEKLTKQGFSYSGEQISEDKNSIKLFFGIEGVVLKTITVYPWGTINDVKYLAYENEKDGNFDGTYETKIITRKYPNGAKFCCRKCYKIKGLLTSVETKFQYPNGIRLETISCHEEDNPLKPDSSAYRIVIHPDGLHTYFHAIIGHPSVLEDISACGIAWEQRKTLQYPPTTNDFFEYWDIEVPILCSY